MLWAEMKRIASELKKHERILLFAETETIAPDKLPEGVVGRVFCEGGERWRLLVNTTGERMEKLKLEPLGIKITQLD